MLRISKLTDYGTVIMNMLVVQPESLLSATAIAEQVHVALPTVTKLLKLLSGAGLVKAERGATGGYRLAKEPAGISIADVITAIEGAPALTECSVGPDVCNTESTCTLRGNWQVINRVVMQVLQNISLVDMTGPLKKQLRVVEE